MICIKETRRMKEKKEGRGRETDKASQGLQSNVFNDFNKPTETTLWKCFSLDMFTHEINTHTLPTSMFIVTKDLENLAINLSIWIMVYGMWPSAAKRGNFFFFFWCICMKRMQALKLSHPSLFRPPTNKKQFQFCKDLLRKTYIEKTRLQYEQGQKKLLFYNIYHLEVFGILFFHWLL